MGCSKGRGRPRLAWLLLRPSCVRFEHFILHASCFMLIYIYIYICMCIYIYIYTFLYLSISLSHSEDRSPGEVGCAEGSRQAGPQAPARLHVYTRICMYIYIMYIYTYVHIYIYIYIEREREYNLLCYIISYCSIP